MGNSFHLLVYGSRNTIISYYKCYMLIPRPYKHGGQNVRFWHEDVHKSDDDNHVNNKGCIIQPNACLSIKL